VIPAEGPSFGVAPSGMWICTWDFLKKPKPGAYLCTLLWRYVQAISADSSTPARRTGENKMRPTGFCLFLLVATVLFSAPASVTAGAPGRKGKMEKPAGLKPVFPENAPCTGISSPYGSNTRYDGSRRPAHRFGGRHGGIDLSLPEGTPLLALAGGTVLKKGKGGRMEGIYLWLRHPPEKTGLSYWIYSKYQHLRSLPELAVGSDVSLGQVVGYSGRTGTAGGHYGNDGYPHLHLSIFKSTTGKVTIKNSRVMGPGSSLADPVRIFHEIALERKKAPDPPPRDKTVEIPYMSEEGKLFPQETRIVWPVACRAK